MAEIIRFSRVPCALADLDEHVAAMKEGYGSDLGGFALICWSRSGEERNAGYVAGPHDPEGLPLIVAEILSEVMHEDDEIEVTLEPSNSNGILEALIDRGIIRDGE